MCTQTQTSEKFGLQFVGTSCIDCIRQGISPVGVMILSGDAVKCDQRGYDHSWYHIEQKVTEEI